MFRIVQLDDGSTAIYDRMSGAQISVITQPKKSTPAANEAAAVAAQQPGRASPSSTKRATPPTAAAAAVANKRPSTAASPLAAATAETSVTCTASNSTHVEPVASTSSASAASAPEAATSSTTATPVLRSRTLRPRNAVTEYNEDKRFDSMMRGKRAAASNSTSNGRKRAPPAATGPDHLVVVYKQSDQGNAPSTPNRMRLLPAATFSKLRQEVAQKVSDSRSTCDEPENGNIDRETFGKYLNLVPTADFERFSRAELETNWPLRQHTRRRPVKRQIIKGGVIDDELPAPASRHSIRLVDGAEPNNNLPSSSNQNGNDGNDADDGRMTKAKWLAGLKAKSPQKTAALIVRSDDGKTLLLATAPLNVPILNVPPFSTLHQPQQQQLSQQLRREDALMW